MFPVPLTFYYDFTQCSDAMYPIIMEEFARNGIKNLVLADNLIDILTRSPTTIGKVEKYANDAGINFCDAHGIFGVEWCLNAPNKRLRSAMLNQQRLAIDLCNYFNVKTITIHVGSMRPPVNQAISREEHLKSIKESLAELLPYAEKMDVTICIENIWHHINQPAALLEIKKEFPTPFLGFCYDAGHANIMDNGRLHPEGEARLGAKFCGQTEPEWDDRILEKMLPHVVSCHLHDNDGSHDAHDLPGKGNVKWDHILPLLCKAPNLKVMQCEVIPVKHGISIPLLSETFRKLEEKFSC